MFTIRIECKHLLSRMLVTNPANRATLHEVAQHPWMNKGYDGAPNNYLPVREPIRFGELDANVIKEMTGFEFGTPEEIENKLGDVLTSDQYLNALALWEERHGRRPSMHRSESSERLGRTKSTDTQKVRSPSKRFSGLGFYGKKLTGNITAAFSGRHEDSLLDGMNGINGKQASLTTGAGGVKTDLTDPTKGFHPLLSIYFLVKERMERDRIYGPGVFASSSLSLPGVTSTSGSSISPPAPALAAQHKSAFAARDTPTLNLLPPAPAATLNRDSKISQPPASPHLQPAPRNAAHNHVGTAPLSSPSAEDAFSNRRGSTNKHRRNTTMPASAPVSPAPMQIGFRRTAAPDEGTETSAQEPSTAREARSSAPASHRHSMQLPPSARPMDVRSITPVSAHVEGIAMSSSPSSGGFVKRFGSILGRSHGDSDIKKHNRSRIPSISHSPPKEVLSAIGLNGVAPPSNPDVPLTQYGSAGKGMTRSSTTGAASLQASNIVHGRGASVDVGRPTSTERPSDSGPPIGVDRRRQASMSLASRRPRTTGSLAAQGSVPEADENEAVVDSTDLDLSDNNATTDSKPIYLKVSLHALLSDADTC
jgi:hypothetical protein